MDHNLQSNPTAADKILHFPFVLINFDTSEKETTGTVINSISFVAPNFGRTTIRPEDFKKIEVTFN